MFTAPACFVADLGSANTLDCAKLSAGSWNGIKCVGVIHRATRSNGEIDPDYAIRLPQIIAAGMLPGAYAFNTGETAAVQAARLINITSPDIPTLCRALDFETNPSGNQMSLGAALEFLDRIDQAFGRRTMIYSGDRIKTVIVSATDQQRDFLAAHALWGCEYGPTFKNIDDNGKSLPWPKPLLWQFTGDGVAGPPTTLSGLQQGADLSVFAGTRDQLAEVWAGAAIVAVAPPVVVAQASPAMEAATSSWFGQFKRTIGLT